MSHVNTQDNRPNQSGGFLNSLVQNSQSSSEFVSQSEWARGRSGNIGWNRNVQSNRRPGDRRH